MVTKEEAKKEIMKLIEKFNKIKDDKALMGNEKQICDSLIRPFCARLTFCANLGLPKGF